MACGELACRAAAWALSNVGQRLLAIDGLG